MVSAFAGHSRDRLPAVALPLRCDGCRHAVGVWAKPSDPAMTPPLLAIACVHNKQRWNAPKIYYTRTAPYCATSRLLSALSHR